MNIGKELKIGILVVAGGLLLVLGVNYLKGFNPFGGGMTYYAVYERIDGLATSNPVIVNGFKVGQVSQIEFAEDGTGVLIVSFIVNKDRLRVPKDTQAKIFSSDLFGTKAIELIPGRSTELAAAYDTLGGDIELGLAESVKRELIPLRQKTDQLIEGVDEILINLQNVFRDSATQGLPQVFESIQRTVTTLESMSEQLDLTVKENRDAVKGILDNVEGITLTVNAHQGELANVISNFSSISDSLAGLQLASTMAKADRSLNAVTQIIEKVNRGEGSLGAMLTSDSLHNGLLETDRELRHLINDLYLNPQRYVRVSVFGRKEHRRMSEKELERLRMLIDEELESRGE
ncbi:MAG: MlaD family protein [Flavobacteriales bacterium]|nr:MlaD family protein [Flavobacteriales bacterium]